MPTRSLQVVPGQHILTNGQLDKDALESAFADLLKGVPGADDRLIVAAIPLTSIVVGQHLQQNIDLRYLRDDIRSSAFLKCTEIVKSLAAKISAGESPSIKSVKAFLERCLVNDLRKNYRGGKRHDPNHRRYRPEFTQPKVDPFDPVNVLNDYMATGYCTAKTIEQHFGLLPPDERIVFGLRLHGKDLNFIADTILGKTVRTAQRLYKSAADQIIGGIIGNVLLGKKSQMTLADIVRSRLQAMYPLIPAPHFPAPHPHQRRKPRQARIGQRLITIRDRRSDPRWTLSHSIRYR